MKVRDLVQFLLPIESNKEVKIWYPARDRDE